jgi:glycosyltransferase involved in cell wall biosynthesis
MPDRPLRILQVTATSAGGAWFRDQVTGLAALGHTVRAVLPGEGPLSRQLRAAGIPVTVIRFGGSRVRQLPRIVAAEARLVRLVRAFRPDVIHAHLLKAVISGRLAGLAAWPALQVSQVPGTVHLQSPLLRWLDVATLAADDLVIGSCQAIAEQYRAMGARRVAVSYYGCDVHRLDPGSSGAAFRREFGLATDTPTVGMLAHMYPTRLRAFQAAGVKGHEVFVDAAPLILALVPGARLFVVGDELAGDGGYRRGLEARAAALGLAGRVIFTGHRDDTAAVLAALDVVAVPSISESASYAVVEALLMERGVVASSVGGLPDTVRDGETGLLVPPADPAALAGAVARLLADPAWRRQLGRRGRSRCLRQFDIEATVAQLAGLYRSALAERAGAAGPAPAAGTGPAGSAPAANTAPRAGPAARRGG